MGIDFSKFGKFADEIKSKVDATLADDGKISENEIRDMKLKKEQEQILRQELSGMPGVYEDAFVVTKKNNGATYSILLNKGKTSGRLDLTKDSMDYYKNKFPEADIVSAYLKDGVVYLQNKYGEQAVDSNGEPVTFSFKQEENEGSLDLISYYLNHNNGVFDLAKLNTMRAIQDKINSTPEVAENYSELMNSIEFDKADKEGKTRMLFEQAKKNLAESDNFQDIMSNLFSCVMLNCQVNDYELGIPKIREDFNKYFGLDKIANAARSLVNDGDETNLSVMENVVSELIGGVKGAENFMTSTQLLAFASMISAAALSSEVVGAGEIFGIATTAFFGYQAGATAVNGIIDGIHANTPEEAELAGEQLGVAAMMMLGVAKGAKHIGKNINKTLEDPFMIVKTGLENAKTREELVSFGASIKEMVNLAPEQRLELNKIFFKKSMKFRAENSEIQKGIVNMYRKNKIETEELLSPELKAHFEKYAQDNNYEMSYTKTGNIVFRSNGKIVRRIDLDETGQVKMDTVFWNNIKDVNPQKSDMAKKTEDVSVNSEPKHTVETDAVHQRKPNNEVKVTVSDNYNYAYLPKGVRPWDLVEEAEPTKMAVFDKLNEILPDIINSVPKGEEMDKPIIIQSGINRIGIFVDKVRTGGNTTNVVIKHWLGDKQSWKDRARVETFLHYKLDKFGNLLKAEISWSDRFKEGDTSEHSYEYRTGPDVLPEIVHTEKYYPDRHYEYPAWERTSRYSRSGQNPNAFDCTSGNARVTEETITIDPNEPGLMNNFLSLIKRHREEESGQSENNYFYDDVSSNRRVQEGYQPGTPESGVVLKPVARFAESRTAEQVLHAEMSGEQPRFTEYEIDILMRALDEHKIPPQEKAELIRDLLDLGKTNGKPLTMSSVKAFLDSTYSFDKNNPLREKSMSLLKALENEEVDNINDYMPLVSQISLIKNPEKVAHAVKNYNGSFYSLLNEREILKELGLTSKDVVLPATPKKYSAKFYSGSFEQGKRR